MPRLPYTNFHDLNLNWFLKEFKKIIASVAGKQDKPAQDGTAGQVLGLNDSLQPVWVNQEAGTIDYSELENKPSINGVELSGNKTGTELGVIDTPATPGTAGQVLGLDESLTPKWIDQEGGSFDFDITGTASGAIASFDDGANNEPLVDLQIAIEPVQAGTGDPSPSNIRPISGWTGANVYRAGRNLFPYTTVPAYTYSWYSGSKALADATQPIALKGGETYILSAIPDSEYATYTWQFLVRAWYTDGRILSGDDLSVINLQMIGGGFSYEYQAAPQYFSSISTVLNGALRIAPTKDVIVDIRIQSGRGKGNSPQLELGSASPTAYELYQGETYPITWQSAGTIYGGTLKPITGELVIDRAIITYTGSGAVYDATPTSPRIYIPAPGFLSSSANSYSDLCNVYPNTSGPISTTSQNTAFCFYGNRIYLRDAAHTTLADFNAYAIEMANNETPITFIGHISPITYTIAQQTIIRTLLGFNNIWADTGDILQCVYKADPDLYLKNVTKVKILTPSENSIVLKPFPTTYNFGERTTLTLTATADTYYKFMFKCPSNAVTNITINGAADTAGDIPAAGKTYIVEIWAGIANYTELVLAVG